MTAIYRTSPAVRPSNAPPLYNADFEHDGCGTGFVAHVSGEASHAVVRLAVQAVVNLTHRGAVSADAESGDGAGVTIQLPRDLLAPVAAAFGLPHHQLHRLGLAMVFLPANESHRPEARTLLEAAVARGGIDVLGWRQVPIDSSVLGGLALETLPGIEQLLVAKPVDFSQADFARALYLARRRAETAYRTAGIDAYIASMSAETVVYKGLMVAPQLSSFFPDLLDERVRSALALFHQRFATNTLPNWKLAQPFRMLGHNGEINTIRGNRNWMAAREPELTSDHWQEELSELFPVVWPTGSDSASLDEALDLLVSSGRDALEAMAILIPEAWEKTPAMPEQLRAFYEYHACLTEPWDGPAALVFTDGTVAAGATDRNGLRPARYKVTTDGLVVLSSEVGVLDIPPGNIIESGRLEPGEMIAVDTAGRGLVRNDELKREMSARHPYGAWVATHIRRLRRETGGDRGRRRARLEATSAFNPTTAQVLHGYTTEEIKRVLKPMANAGKEAVGSMGDDAPASVLNGSSRLLYSYFRQRFAQVTNPPIDSIREKTVMSLDVYLGRRRSLLGSPGQPVSMAHLPTPILRPDERTALLAGDVGLSATQLDATFGATEGVSALSRSLDDLCVAAVMAVDAGHEVLVISDRSVGADRAPIPMLLAVATVHHHLIRNGRRMRASLVADAGDARDVHHFAALIGFGASAVHPYVAIETVAHLAREGGLDSLADEGLARYFRAAEAGVLKVMSKMGISSLASYHGAQMFEALGLGEKLIARSFPGTTSRIGGIGLEEIAADVLERHTRAYAGEALVKGGWYSYRRNGDYHANAPPVWRALHDVVLDGGHDEYRAYSDLVHSRPPTALRDLLTFESDRTAIDLDRVEPIDAITRRFQTGAMSLGALGKEAHEDIARAMNRVGGFANTGEGGEDPRRYLPGGDKQDACSSIKQVASGRFGVTASYLASAKELEIKIAQGSKPGEGGQLPGMKVSAYIGELRHVYPGTPLISPPPHHDIYSIEDIAQLIYDLKMVNPAARVCVKLVAAEGVGTIAAGVAKAYADVIQISGADGGTGASPLSSVKYAGNPWELGLAETQQTLVMNGLRGRVTLSTDGGLHTGRDVVMAAMLGADRYGFGTAALIALGCKMARQCHSNTCPVGIATQAEEYRKKYFGKPEMLIAFLTHVAMEVREILASLGYERLDDVIGRADLLQQVAVSDGRRWRAVDLSKLLAKPDGGPLRAIRDRNVREDTPLDDSILVDLSGAIERGEPFSGTYPIANTDRTVGGRVAGLMARHHGDAGLPPGTIDLRFTGSAGQSFGAWAVNGLRLRLTGEANDYVAKGMAGGEVAIRPAEPTGVRDRQPTLVGNTVLYGATGGKLFVAGAAGERFAVRNSGAYAVVEGLGMHGCEYMTRGVVVVLGETGRNFGAGMSGGMAFVFDEAGFFPARMNPTLVTNEPLTGGQEIELLRLMLQRHHELTGSTRARTILRQFPHFLSFFWKVAPRPIATAGTHSRPPRRRVAEVLERFAPSVSAPPQP